MADEYVSKLSVLTALRYAKNFAIAKVIEEGGEYEKMPQTGKACYDGMCAAFDICIKVVEEAELINDETIKG